MLESKNVSVSIKVLNEKRNAGQISVDMVFQRDNKPAWMTPEFRGLFLDSITRGYPTGQLTVFEALDGTWYMANGKQRLFFLSSTIDNTGQPFVDLEDDSWNGTFSTWNEENREIFMAHKFSVCVVKNVDQSEMAEIFGRLNNDIPLSNIEKLRGKIASVVGNPEFVAALNLLYPHFAVNKKGLRKVTRSSAEELLLQALSTINSDNRDYSGIEVAGVLRKSQAANPDKMKTDITILASRVNTLHGILTIDESAEAPELKSWVKKSMLSAMLAVGIPTHEALEAFKFDSSKHSGRGPDQLALKDAAGSGSAKIEHVTARIEVFEKLLAKTYSGNVFKPKSTSPDKPKNEAPKQEKISQEYEDSWGPAATVESVKAALQYVLDVAGTDSHPYKAPVGGALGLQYIDKSGRRQTVPLAELMSTD